MFGKKRPNIDVNQSFDSTSNKDDLNLSVDQESKKFIFYDKDKNFTSQLEVYIQLKNYNKKILIIIGIESSFEELKETIINSLRAYPDFKNINKINPEGLYKIVNNSYSVLPVEGKIKDYVNSGDILYCNLFTDEFWIKTYFNIKSHDFKIMIKTEYKLKKKMKYKKFKLMLMKGGIQFFIDNIKNTEYTDFNYYLKFFEFKIKKHQMIITHNVHNKQKNKMPIEKIINNKSEIIVKLNFAIFEKLIHKNIKLSKTENNNRLRINEYTDLTFEELMNDKRFTPEYTAIRQISEDFLENQKNNNNPNFLFYTKKKAKNLKNKLLSKKNFRFFDEPKPIDEINEDNEDKDDNIPKSFDINKNDEKNILTNSNKINNDNIDNIDNEDINIKINNIIKENNNEIIIPIKKKEKVEKIKNMIIITKKIIKEDKKKKKFSRLITHNFDKKNEISKNLPKININSSVSNKNLIIYENNFGKFSESKDTETKNLKIPYNSQESINSDYQVKDFKPKPFNEKNNIFNFGESKKNLKEGLDELLLNDQQDENINFKDKFQTTVFNKKNKEFKGSFLLNNPSNTEPYLDEGTSSHFEEDIQSELKTQVSPKARKKEKSTTYKFNPTSAFFSAFKNRNKVTDISEDLKSEFDKDKFIEYLANKFNNFYDKNAFDKIKMPPKKEIEYLDKEHKFLINQKKDKQFIDNQNGTKFHVHIFMILLFLFLALVLLFLNLDFFQYIYR